MLGILIVPIACLQSLRIRNEPPSYTIISVLGRFSYKNASKRVFVQGKMQIHPFKSEFDIFDASVRAGKHAHLI